MSSTVLEQAESRAGLRPLERVRTYFVLLLEGGPRKPFPAPGFDERTRSYLKVGVALLILLCAVRMHWTWETWGNLSTDSGREIYAPLVISEGGTLYQDVWYPYGPAAPYLNSVLFRIFGLHFSIPYVIGTIAALGSGIFLFLTGIELSFPLAGWTAGAVVVIQAFTPGLFQFLLPYSSAGVYACLVSCAFLWLLVCGLDSGGWIWMSVEGLLAASILLAKPEYGVSCYLTLGLAILLRAMRGKKLKLFAMDLLALLPGVVLTAAVVAWMVSLRGAEFIAQENVLAWPSSYFMKTYGKPWLGYTGFTLTRGAFVEAWHQTAIVVGVLAAIGGLLARGKRGLRGWLLLVLLLLGVVAYWRVFLPEWSPGGIAVALFFPRAMVFYTMLGGALAAWSWLRGGMDLRAARVVLLLAFSGLLAFRVMLKMMPEEFPIFYNGPVVLAYLILASVLFRVRGEGWRPLRPEVVVLAGCLAAVGGRAAVLGGRASDWVPFPTPYGTLRVPERVRENYQEAVRFLREKQAQGQAVMVLPEDTMLYVLSGARAPTRVNEFVPGFLAPGRMTSELFGEIERKNVRYLLWSNRIFPEYGVPILGRDFNRELGDYLKAHYRRVGLLVPGSEKRWGLAFTVWERIDRPANP